MLQEASYTATVNKRICASATLEATLVIPLYMYAMLSIMFVIRVLNVYINVDKAAYSTARELAKYSYVYSKESSVDNLMPQMYASFYKNIGFKFGGEQYVYGGTLGFDLSGSSIAKNSSELELRVRYLMRNPFDIFGWGIIKVEQVVRNELWLGAKASGDWDDAKPENTKVYITKWGTVYHTNRGCKILNIDTDRVRREDVAALRSKDGSKYYACDFCGGNKSSEWVFITKYGTNYHSDEHCSAIHRDVTEIDISQVGDRRCCSQCGK